MKPTDTLTHKRTQMQRTHIWGTRLPTGNFASSCLEDIGLDTLDAMPARDAKAKAKVKEKEKEKAKEKGKANSADRPETRTVTTVKDGRHVEAFSTRSWDPRKQTQLVETRNQ